MTRRRKPKESSAEILFKAPWWISIVIGVVIYVVLKWIAPGIWGSSLILKPITSALSGLAWLFSGIFIFIGAAALAREKFSASKSGVAGSSAAWNPRVIAGGKRSSSPGFSLTDQPSPEPDRVWEAWKAKPAAANTPPTEWSIALLQDIEWKRFEDVCQRFYTLKGFRAETTQLGADGGIDIRLYLGDAATPSSIVQCKAWGEKAVGIKPVRELLGVMAHEKIPKGFFMAASDYTDDARAFAESNPITLITGDMLITMIQRLPETEKQTLLAFATEGDYHTPTCPSCGIKMKPVSGSGGRSDFWGCRNYPRCRQKIGMRAGDRS